MGNLEFSKNNSCRLCSSKNIEPFLSLPAVALAGNPVSEPFGTEPGACPLTASYCQNCGLVQLSENVTGDIYKNYLYTPAHSEGFKSYIEWLCDDLVKIAAPSNVIEIGSSDGALIEKFQQKGVDALGFEPSEALAQKSKAAGLNVINDYFSASCLKKLPESHKKNDLLVMRHVLEHLNDFDTIFKAITDALNYEKGVLAIEVPYLGAITEGRQFYAFFHEHLSYFSYSSLEKLLDKYGFRIFSARPNELEGGSMLIYAEYAAKKSGLRPQKIDGRFLNESNLTSLLELKKLNIKMSEYCFQFKNIVNEARISDMAVCGWGAGQRGVSLINICGFDSHDISYVVDLNPNYHGRFIPGTDIPIVSRQKIAAYPPDAIIIFATGYIEGIMRENKEFVDRGGKFIAIIPEARWI